MSNILTAINIAAEAHLGQTRKGSNLPFLVHPARVAAALALKDYNQEVQCIAWLHDVLEDCGTAVRPKYESMIERNFILSVSRAVKELTGEGSSRLERHTRLLTKMPLMSTSAKIVKAYDRADNLRDIAYRIRTAVSGAESTYTLIGRGSEYATISRDILPILEGGDAAEALGSAIEDVFNAIKGN